MSLGRIKAKRNLGTKIKICIAYHYTTDHYTLVVYLKCYQELNLMIAIPIHG